MITDDSLYNPCGGNICLDFTSSVGRTATITENERLVDYAALLGWSIEAGSLSDSDARALERAAGARPGAARHVYGRALALREAIFEIFHAEVHERRPASSAFEVLHGELARALPHARVVPMEEGYGWGWCDTDSELDAPLWPIVRAAAELLVSPEREEIKECAANNCIWIFVDHTRNHGRRWCEKKGCGNRENVRGHRRRKRREAGR